MILLGLCSIVAARLLAQFKLFNRSEWVFETLLAMHKSFKWASLPPINFLLILYGRGGGFDRKCLLFVMIY